MLPSSGLRIETGLGIHGSGGECTASLRNVGKFSPKDMASHPGSLESSSV